ncbi:MAG: type VII secretion-associated protein, partial [Gordonia sp. (in: high G+C Gram-positive bacteria)]
GARGRGGPAVFAWEPPPESRRSRRVRWAACAVAVLTVVALGVLARVTAPAPAAQAAVTERIGPARLDVPGGWRRSELSEEAGVRAVFADPADGRRLIVVVTRLRSGATRETVATSLRNRIAQRGDAVVVEFAPDSRYAGRRVISYREQPESGPEVRWYVVVERDVQITIGCQNGTGGQRMDPRCRAAVGSAAVG